jgi:hypothetical protein
MDGLDDPFDFKLGVEALKAKTITASSSCLENTQSSSYEQHSLKAAETNTTRTTFKSSNDNENDTNNTNTNTNTNNETVAASSKEVFVSKTIDGFSTETKVILQTLGKILERLETLELVALRNAKEVARVEHALQGFLITKKREETGKAPLRTEDLFKVDDDEDDDDDDEDERGEEEERRMRQQPPPQPRGGPPPPGARPPPPHHHQHMEYQRQHQPPPEYRGSLAQEFRGPPPEFRRSPPPGPPPIPASPENHHHHHHQHSPQPPPPPLPSYGNHYPPAAPPPPQYYPPPASPPMPPPPPATIQSEEISLDIMVGEFSSMGFTRDEVMTVLGKMRARNEATEMNAILDKLMSGEGRL